MAIKLEGTKTKHPQLLYESKLYKILSGGGESSGVELVRSLLSARVSGHSVCAMVWRGGRL